jgi:hypothetical protein|tara:strand:- start:1558 stop:1665 length:108 start_codon:yes stop_codon:yes gene_type:complete
LKSAEKNKAIPQQIIQKIKEIDKLAKELAKELEVG